MAANVGSIQSVAHGAALGELFRYEITKPVSIGRQRSAMLPIVSQEVEAEKVSIYDERVLAKHPLAGLRLVNSTAVNLMQGPVTVYDGGAYAGDARIGDLAPGSERLISYAVDLDVEVAPRAEPLPEAIVSVRLMKGTLVVTRKLARRKLFEIKNSGRLADPATLLKVAADHFPDVQIIATGSSMLGASSRFRDTLAGRKRTVRLLPVLNRELPAFGIQSPERRLLHGGLPEHLTASAVPEKDFSEWLEAFWARDILELFSVGKRYSFLRFLELLWACLPCPLDQHAPIG